MGRILCAVRFARCLVPSPLDGICSLFDRFRPPPSEKPFPSVALFALGSLQQFDRARQTFFPKRFEGLSQSIRSPLEMTVPSSNSQLDHGASSKDAQLHDALISIAP
jgi:hypothetical protein